ncbi:MAG: hypothetical protein V1743_04730 [Nanoarchaeota archaeon]
MYDIVCTMELKNILGMMMPHATSTAADGQKLRSRSNSKEAVFVLRASPEGASPGASAPWWRAI